MSEVLDAINKIIDRYLLRWRSMGISEDKLKESEESLKRQASASAKGIEGKESTKDIIAFANGNRDPIIGGGMLLPRKKA